MEIILNIAFEMPFGESALDIMACIYLFLSTGLNIQEISLKN